MRTLNASGANRPLLPNVSNRRSAGRLPAFARVDLRLTWKSARRWEIYIEVINALNRKNASTLTPKLAYNPASDRPTIVQVPDQGFPLLPIFGIRWRF